ncbi:MAG: hypothetical protein V7761_13425, partial [Amylibacter sp.]
SYIEGTPTALLGDVFTVDTGKTTIAAGASSIFIARLDQINGFDDSIAENQTLRDAVQQQLDSQIGNDLLTVFANALREEAGVSINQAAINQINVQLTGGQ